MRRTINNEQIFLNFNKKQKIFANIFMLQIENEN